MRRNILRNLSGILGRLWWYNEAVIRRDVVVGAPSPDSTTRHWPGLTVSCLCFQNSTYCCLFTEFLYAYLMRKTLYFLSFPTSIEPFLWCLHFARRTAPKSRRFATSLAVSMMRISQHRETWELISGWFSNRGEHLRHHDGWVTVRSFPSQHR